MDNIMILGNSGTNRIVLFNVDTGEVVAVANPETEVRALDTTTGDVAAIVYGTTGVWVWDYQSTFIGFPTNEWQNSGTGNLYFASWVLPGQSYVFEDAISIAWGDIQTRPPAPVSDGSLLIHLDELDYVRIPQPGAGVSELLTAPFSAVDATVVDTLGRILVYTAREQA